MALRRATFSGKVNLPHVDIGMTVTFPLDTNLVRISSKYVVSCKSSRISTCRNASSAVIKYWKCWNTDSTQVLHIYTQHLRTALPSQQMHKFCPVLQQTPTQHDECGSPRQSSQWNNLTEKNCQNYKSRFREVCGKVCPNTGTCSCSTNQVQMIHSLSLCLVFAALLSISVVAKNVVDLGIN